MENRQLISPPGAFSVVRRPSTVVNKKIIVLCLFTPITCFVHCWNDDKMCDNNNYTFLFIFFVFFLSMRDINSVAKWAFIVPNLEPSSFFIRKLFLVVCLAINFLLEEKIVSILQSDDCTIAERRKCAEFSPAFQVVLPKKNSVAPLVDTYTAGNGSG